MAESQCGSRTNADWIATHRRRWCTTAGVGAACAVASMRTVPDGNPIVWCQREGLEHLEPSGCGARRRQLTIKTSSSSSSQSFAIVSYRRRSRNRIVPIRLSDQIVLRRSRRRIAFVTIHLVRCHSLQHTLPMCEQNFLS